MFSSGVNCWLFSVIMLRYLAQDLGALGHPVLGILLSRNNEGGLGDFFGRTATLNISLPICYWKIGGVC